METATGDSAYNLKTRSQKANIDPVNEIQLLKKVSNGSPEVQALSHDDNQEPLNQGLGHVRRLEQENSSNIGRELKLIGENTLMTS